MSTGKIGFFGSEESYRVFKLIGYSSAICYVTIKVYGTTWASK